MTSEELVDEKAVKKEAKLAQLAAARESGKNRKRQRDDDMSSMKDQLVRMTSLLEAKTEVKAEAKVETEKEEEEPQAKRPRVVVVKERPENEYEEPASEGGGWMQAAIRSTAILSLGAATWYMQNVYGKSKPIPAPKKVVATKTPATSPIVRPVMGPPSRKQVGGSGFHE